MWYIVSTKFAVLRLLHGKDAVPIVHNRVVGTHLGASAVVGKCNNPDVPML